MPKGLKRQRNINRKARCVLLDTFSQVLQTLVMGAMRVKKLGTGYTGFVALVLTATLGTGCGKKLGEQKFEGIACGTSDQYASYMNPMDSTLVQTVSIDSAFSN